MKIFEYLILFFSFAFTLALTHLLFAMTRMIRHRRELVFSIEHALWMANALFLLLANWLSLFDYRGKESFDLGSIAVLMVFVITLYFACALVSPDFEDDEQYDMRAFHRREGRTYIGALAMLIVVSFIANIDASREGVAVWGQENIVVMWMIPVTFAPLIWRNRAVQLISPLALMALTITFTIIYYPVIN
ncbi:MAG: hypothetical protein V4444_05440 [Pseudomonadota bacterium]